MVIKKPQHCFIKPGFVKKTSCALLLGFYCGTSSSIGLGPLTSSVKIGESYSGEISLLGNEYQMDELAVKRLSAKDAQKMGISVLATNYPLQIGFIEKDSQVRIQLISNKPLRDPYLEFALELQWPTGSVVRHYTVLPDNPNLHWDEPVRYVGNFDADVSNFAGPEQPASALPVYSENPTQITSRLSSQNTSQPGPQINQGDRVYTVRSGDLVSFIARNWGRSTGQSSRALTHDASQWIFKHNPHAFENNDVGSLIVGSQIKLPSPTLLNSQGRLNLDGVSIANNGITNSANVNNTGSNRINEGTTYQASSLPASGQLMLTTNIDSEFNPTNTGANDDSDLYTQVQSLTLAIDMAREEIDRLNRENDYYRQRIEAIENGKVAQLLEQILSLQEQQISRLRSNDRQPTDFVANQTVPSENISIVEASVVGGEGANFPELQRADSVTSGEATSPQALPLKGVYILSTAAGAILLFGLVFLMFRRNQQAPVVDHNSDAPNSNSVIDDLGLEPLDDLDDKTQTDKSQLDEEPKSNQSTKDSKSDRAVDQSPKNTKSKKIESVAVVATAEDKLIPFESSDSLNTAEQENEQDIDLDTSLLTSLSGTSEEDAEFEKFFEQDNSSLNDEPSFELDIELPEELEPYQYDSSLDDTKIETETEDNKVFGITLDEEALKEFDDKDLMEFLESEAENEQPEETAQYEDLPIYELDLINQNSDIGDETQTTDVLIKEIEFYLDMQQVEMARRLIIQLSEEYDGPEIEALKARCEKKSHH